MTQAFRTFTLTIGCLLFAAVSLATAATLPHKYDRSQVEAFVDSLAVDVLHERLGRLFRAHGRLADGGLL